MMLSRRVVWSAFMLGAMAAAATVVMLAQHDPNAENARFRLYTPVNGKGGQELSGPYEVVANWPQPLPGHEQWHTGRGAAVHAASPDRIYVAVTGEIPADYQGLRVWGPLAIPSLHPVTSSLTNEKGRWEHSLMVLDRNGKLIAAWEQWNDVIHGIQRMLVNPYDPERHIWVSSVGIFTRDGKKMVASFRKDCDPLKKTCMLLQGSHWDWLPTNEFFLATNTSVGKYSRNGKKLFEFGKQGSAPGEFGGIHGLVVDAVRNRLYVSDRGNSRIQVFDLNGRPLDTWPNIVAPYCIRLTQDGRYLWVSDGFTQKFGKYDAMSGRLLTSWGTFGAVPGMFWGPHDFDTDSDGNLYVAEDYNARVQKFRPRSDGDPEQLIGALKPGGR